MMKNAIPGLTPDHLPYFDNLATMAEEMLEHLDSTIEAHNVARRKAIRRKARGTGHGDARIISGTNVVAGMTIRPSKYR